jgi:T-complex protein 1 subunit eta
MLSNISACMAVAVTVQTTLGPCGMDKLVHDNKGTTISNDSATIMRLLDIIHSAAKILVDIAKSQDSEVTIHLPASLSVDFAIIAVIMPLVSSP